MLNAGPPIPNLDGRLLLCWPRAHLAVSVNWESIHGSPAILALQSCSLVFGTIEAQLVPNIMLRYFCGI